MTLFPYTSPFLSAEKKNTKIIETSARNLVSPYASRTHLKKKARVNVTFFIKTK